jgi:glycosyltransferase involved in cell wall biosynthesis
LYFGLIKPYKGLEYLLAAMPEIIARFPRVLLVIAGEPLMSLAGIERLIAERGLRDHVSLRPGFVPDSATAHYLHAADLLVAPYVRVGTSGVVALAQGHGLPIVATNVGGLPESVEHGRSGFIVLPRDAPALAAGICRALDDLDELATMGTHGWTRLGRENRWSDVAARTLSVYTS